MLKDSTKGYGIITIALHWISALLIVFLFALGIYMTGLDYYSEWYHKGPALHTSLGLIVFFIMVLRLVWRSANQTPTALATKRYANFAATLLKVLLYLLVFIVLVSGYLITTAEGQPANIFNLVEFPVIFQLNAKGVDIAGKIHNWLAWLIIVFAAVHAVAALIHHFLLRDSTLVRMLKPVSKSNVP